MSEKTGLLIKLDYDFHTSHVCEIFILETWIRVTEREFRSFDGPRRLIRPVGGTPRRWLEGDPTETVDYFGPVYVFHTNDIVPYEGTNKIIYGPDPIRPEERKKEHERAYV